MTDVLAPIAPPGAEAEPAAPRGYVFPRNHISGGSLVVLSLSLAVFSVHVPKLVGFTVARYSDRADRVAT